MKTANWSIFLSLILCLSLIVGGCAKEDEWIACANYSGLDKDKDGVDDGCDPCLGDKENKCADPAYASQTDAGATPPKSDSGSTTTPKPVTGCVVFARRGNTGEKEAWLCGGKADKAMGWTSGCRGGDCKVTHHHANVQSVTYAGVYYENCSWAVVPENSDVAYPTWIKGGGAVEIQGCAGKVVSISGSPWVDTSASALQK
ncbi:MAG: hypothetical protein ABII72_04065 [Parcubacteria group bacterium]